MAWLTTPAHARWLEAETDRLLDFGRRSVVPGGFARQDEAGEPVDGPLELWIACRMTHVYAIGHLLGPRRLGRDRGPRARRAARRVPRRRARRLVRRGLARRHPGRHATRPPTRTRSSSSRRRARPPRAGRARASCSTRRSPSRPRTSGTTRPACPSSSGTARSRTLDGYRGRQRQHAHGRGLPRRRGRHRAAHLARPRAADHRDGRARLRRREPVAHPRALRRAVEPGPRLQPRRAGAPVPPVRRDDRALARVVAAHAARPRRADRRAATSPRPGCSPTRPPCSTPPSREGWDVDGAPGFVYTVDWSGKPVVRERMHWVAAEAVGAAAALHAATGEERFDDALHAVVGVHRRAPPGPRRRLVVARARDRRTRCRGPSGRARPTSTTRSRPRSSRACRSPR